MLFFFTHDFFHSFFKFELLSNLNYLFRFLIPYFKIHTLFSRRDKVEKIVRQIWRHQKGDIFPIFFRIW